MSGLYIKWCYSHFNLRYSQGHSGIVGDSRFKNRYITWPSRISWIRSTGL